MEALHLINQNDDENDMNTNVLRGFNDEDGFDQNRFDSLVHLFIHYQFFQLNNCY